MATRTTKKVSAKPRTVRRGVEKKEKPIGTVTHYYNGLGVAIVKFSKPVKVGIKVRVAGATTAFEQEIDSMQYDHQPITLAPKGKEIGIKVKERTREGDAIYLVR